MNLSFYINSIMLGVGLAMDAFSVSLANGLNETHMKRSKMCTIAGTFAFFQALMPMLGWISVHTIVEYFTSFQKYIPIIALLLLSFIGIKMLIDGIRNKDEKIESVKLTFVALLLQGIATSIDALSVGFTIAENIFIEALAESLIIALVTFIICIIGLVIGKKFGTKLSNKAQILGGIILIVIGIEIFISNLK